MSYGLKGKVKEMITRMNAIREDKEKGRDIGLRQFMAEEYKDSTGNPLQPGHLYSELSINPRRTTVNELMSDEDNKYLMSEIVRDGVKRGMGLAQREKLNQAREASLAPVTADGGRERFMSREVFLDPINRGLVQSTFYPDLVVDEVPVSQPNVTIPKIELSDAKLKETNEAATIEEGSVTYGSKDVKLKKKGRALKVSYEAIEFNSLSLAQIFFSDAGRILGHTLNSMAVDTVVKGDQADNSEAASVIGVEDTSKGVQYIDLARVAIQFSLIGRTGIQAIGNGLTALDYVVLPEFKDKQFKGASLLQTMLKTPLTFPEELYVSLGIPEDQVAIQDPSMSMVQLTAIPLMMETEKIISKQLFNTVASIFTGFAKLQRNASTILDGSIEFANNPFPAWMQPYDE